MGIVGCKSADLSGNLHHLRWGVRKFVFIFSRTLKKNETFFPLRNFNPRPFRGWRAPFFNWVVVVSFLFSFRRVPMLNNSSATPRILTGANIIIMSRGDILDGKWKEEEGKWSLNWSSFILSLFSFLLPFFSCNFQYQIIPSHLSFFGTCPSKILFRSLFFRFSNFYVVSYSILPDLVYLSSRALTVSHPPSFPSSLSHCPHSLPL